MKTSTQRILAAALVAGGATSIAIAGCNPREAEPSNEPAAEQAQTPAEDVGTAASAVNATTCVDLYPQKDTAISDTNTIIGDDKTGQKGGSWTLDIADDRNYAETSSLLAQWDLSTLPAGASIISATANLTASSFQKEAPDRFYFPTADSTGVSSSPLKIHPISASWAEGTVTWNNFPGYSNSFTATFSAPTASKPLTSTDVTQLALGWRGNPSTNYGVIIERSSSPSPYGWTTVRSKEGGAHIGAPAGLSLHVCYATAPVCSSGKWGAGSYGVVQHASDLDFAPGAALSVGFWANFQANTSQTILVKGDNSTNEWSIDYYNGNLCFNRQGLANLVCAPVSTGAWHHYGVTYGNTGYFITSTIWQDGAAKNSSIGALIGASHNSQLTVGTFPGGVSTLHGDIDDLAIWSTDLAVPATPNLMAQLAGGTDPSTVVPAALVAHWSFSEAAGPTTFDLTGKHHDMALTNVAWDPVCQNPGASGCAAPGAPACVASDLCHTPGTCDHTTGYCSNPPIGPACTAQDQCHAIGTCSPANGLCSNPALADGAACNDGNPATTNDQCTSGVCGGTVPVVCSSAIWNATNAMGTVPASSTLEFGPTDSFSVGMWASFDPQLPEFLLNKGSYAAPEWSLVSFNGQLCFDKELQNPVRLACTSSPSGWHHIVVTYASGSTSIYIDGALQVTGSGQVGAKALTAIEVGNHSGTTANMSGLMDDLAIWNRALSASDVQHLYHAASTPVSVGNLVGWWPLSEGSGATTSDASGNGHTMSLANVTWPVNPAAAQFPSVPVKHSLGAHDAGICAPGSVPAVAPASCNALPAGSANGVYWVDPDGSAGSHAPFATYCDMDTGGDMLVANVWIPAYASAYLAGAPAIAALGQFTLDGSESLAFAHTVFQCRGSQGVAVDMHEQWSGTLATLNGMTTAGGIFAQEDPNYSSDQYTNLNFTLLHSPGLAAQDVNNFAGGTVNFLHGGGLTPNYTTWYGFNGANQRFIVNGSQVHCAQDYAVVGGQSNNPVLGQWGRIWVR